MRRIAMLVLLAGGVARAQVPEPAPPEDAPPPPEPAQPAPPPPSEPAPSPPAPTPPPIDEKVIDDLSEQQHELAKRLRNVERGKSEIDQFRDQMKSFSRYVHVWVDVGAFAVGGNGSGIRQDIFHTHYAEYKNTVAGEWVFMGDPFSTAINAFGEPADTADSREITGDTINSDGRPSVIVNAVGLDLSKDIGDGYSFAALVDFLPRPGPDILDIEYAHVAYRPSHDVNFILQAGKIDSVLGVEYRSQDAPKRTEVTPSLICRYTCGRPLGVEARLVELPFSASAAITNGDNFEERFEPDDQLKASKLPTVAGHVQWMLPVGQGLEVGVSGAFGPQDGQSNLRVHQWHYGLDAKLVDLAGWQASAEYVQGKQQGSTTGDPDRDRMLGIERPRCDVAFCLHYKGAYLLVERRIAAKLTPYVRLDWRDAVHRSGSTFVYESHTVRATVGANIALSRSVKAKMEYIVNHELGIPAFPHDVIAASVVMSSE